MDDNDEALQSRHAPPPAQASKTLALVAHDKRKKALREWADWNKDLLSRHKLVATGTTGRILREALGIEIHTLKSGPLGGDQQIGSRIADGEIDALIFFWDPLASQAHDSDVKALLRLAVAYNIPIACNRATADYIVSSPLLENNYVPHVDDFDDYLERDV